MNTTEETTGMLDGLAVLVIGAGRGIGGAASRLFAREGARVMLASRREQELKAVAEEIRAAGGTAEHTVCDLGDGESVRAAVARTVERFGRLDGAFNNGAAISPSGPMDGTSEEDFDRVSAIDFKGIWLAMTAEVAAFRATGGTGAIVNTSSVGSLMANPELPVYGAAKRAVNSLTASAAATYGPEGIRVNAVAPGIVRTELFEEWEARSPGTAERITAITPLRRAGAPEEIAEAAAWLLSGRSSFVTGEVLRVDGGAQA